jgi:hypothetical protein
LERYQIRAEPAALFLERGDDEAVALRRSSGGLHAAVGAGIARATMNAPMTPISRIIGPA